MRSVTNVYIYEKDEKFFGEGPYRILKHIEQYGSLRSAAQQMGLSYNKAFHLVKRAEEILGISLTEKTIGGKGGGGSSLTEEAKEFLVKYEQYRDACHKANEEIFERVFGKPVRLGAVFMASGLSLRYGKNKLLEPVGTQTMIERAFACTEDGPFDRQVVVTRSREVEELCGKRNMKVIFHEKEYRSDTIRLGTEWMKEMDGILFLPCDQPLLAKESVLRMTEAFSREREFIYRLAYKEEEGSPVLFPRRYFEELMGLPEKKGGSYVMNRHREDVRTVQAGSRWELFDADTPEDLEKIRRQMR